MIKMLYFATVNKLLLQKFSIRGSINDREAKAGKD